MSSDSNSVTIHMPSKDVKSAPIPIKAPRGRPARKPDEIQQEEPTFKRILQLFDMAKIQQSQLTMRKSAYMELRRTMNEIRKLCIDYRFELLAEREQLPKKERKERKEGEEKRLVAPPQPPMKEVKQPLPKAPPPKVPVKPVQRQPMPVAQASQHEEYSSSEDDDDDPREV